MGLCWWGGGVRARGPGDGSGHSTRESLSGFPSQVLLESEAALDCGFPCEQLERST